MREKTAALEVHKQLLERLGESESHVGSVEESPDVLDGLRNPSTEGSGRKQTCEWRVVGSSPQRCF